MLFERKWILLAWRGADFLISGSPGPCGGRLAAQSLGVWLKVLDAVKALFVLVNVKILNFLGHALEVLRLENLALPLLFFNLDEIHIYQPLLGGMLRCGAILQYFNATFLAGTSSCPIIAGCVPVSRAQCFVRLLLLLELLLELVLLLADLGYRIKNVVLKECLEHFIHNGQQASC